MLIEDSHHHQMMMMMWMRVWSGCQLGRGWGEVGGAEREKVFTLFEKRAFLGKCAKLLCRLDQWQHRPLGQRKMFCLITTAVPHRSRTLAEESAGLWEVGRRYMSAWTIVTSLVWEQNHSHGLLNRWLLSLYLQAGAQKEPALWLAKFPISCQKSEMLKRRRASPHGCGCNNVHLCAAAIGFWFWGTLQQCRTGTQGCYPTSRRVRLSRKKKRIVVTHRSVATNKFYMSGLN